MSLTNPRARRRWWSLAAGALLSALLAGASGSAWAQPSDDDRATARRLAIEAQAALEQRDYTTAADKFARADALFHAPTLLLGLARAQVGLGKLVSAHEGYQRIVREGVPTGGSKQFVDAVEDAKKELGALEPRLPWVTIEVTATSEPPAVTLDSAALPPASVGVKRAVDPGPHTARATANGYTPAERTFTMREGQSDLIRLQLNPTGGAVVAPPPAGQQPPPSAADSGGTGGGNGPLLRTLGVVALVVGGVGLIGGGITGGLAIREHSLLERDCPDNDCPSERQSTIDNFHAMATVSTVGFIVGGVAVAGGITLLILAPSSSPSKAGLSPYIGPGRAGVVGRF